MKPRLGQQCRVRAFVEKAYVEADNMTPDRILISAGNPSPETVFTLIHIGYMSEQRYVDELPLRPVRRKVYFVATGLWRQYRVFPEDVELIEDGRDA